MSLVFEVSIMEFDGVSVRLAGSVDSSSQNKELSVFLTGPSEHLEPLSTVVPEGTVAASTGDGSRCSDPHTELLPSNSLLLELLPAIAAQPIPPAPLGSLQCVLL